MRVALLSTYPPQHCGVGQYAANLAAGYRAAGAEVLVFAERDLGTLMNEPGVNRCWDRRVYHPNELARHVLSSKPDLIDIQHEYGIWPDSARFAELLRCLCEKTHTQLTMHTVARVGHQALYRVLHEQPVLVVVHTTAMLAALPDAHAQLLPHPTPERLVEGLPVRFQHTMVTIGFLGPGKGLEENLEALAFVHAALPDQQPWTYTLVGDIEPNFYQVLAEQVQRLGLDDTVKIVREYVSNESRQRVLAEYEIALVNTATRAESPPSASGVARDILALSTPSISPAVPIYDDLVPQVSGKFVHGRDRSETARRIADLIVSGFWRNESWRLQAISHFKLAQLWTFKEAAKERLRLAGARA